MEQIRHGLDEEVISARFDDASLLRRFWKRSWGTSNAVGQIREILVHRPGIEISRWKEGHYESEAQAYVLRGPKGEVLAYSKSEGPPDLDRLRDEHDQLTGLLRRHGVHVIEVEGQDELMQVFVRDVGMVVPGGIILGRFLHQTRYGESRAALQTAAALGMPVLGMIQGHGYAEGGSFMVLDPRTAIIGRSARVNADGIHQLRELLSWQDMELMVVDLPGSLIHLDEAFVLIDTDKALVRPELLPAWFIDDMMRRGIHTIAVDPADPPSSINCLALEPGTVLFPASGPRTAEQLLRHGIDVIPIDVSELNELGGGIHCSTLELERADVIAKTLDPH